MQIFKYIIGTLAVIYTLAQIVALIGTIGAASSDFNAYSGGMLFGRIAGICIGAAIAAVCFRKSRGRR